MREEIEPLQEEEKLCTVVIFISENVLLIETNNFSFNFAGNLSTE